MSDVRFLLDGDVVALCEVDPTGTVLDLLRYRLRRTGTKEGCAEGDCGACTVLVGALEAGLGGDAVAWRAVNACILFVPMLDGKALLTVESLGGTHPVQRALVERHGSQCGFCTPGFVMSLYGRSIGAAGTAGRACADVLQGNLCRCTGYGPILDAGEAIAAAPRDDGVTVERLRAIRCEGREGYARGAYSDPLSGTVRHWHAPVTTDRLATLLVEHPDARLVAGATDVGLWVTKQHRVLDEIIFIGGIPDLAAIEETAEGVRIGAGVSYAAAWEPLARLHPSLGELVRRIGGTQVRNAGTIGGNIANGSPIGDMPPAFIALGATLTLRRGDARRTLPLEDYFIAYGRQDRTPGEFVESVFVPRPDPATRIAVTKLSKRFDSDISAVCGAFAVRVADGRVAEARIAFGGMAATPKRAAACEAALTGAAWDEATIVAGMRALAEDYAPLGDVRGSSAYRLTVAANLLKRLWLEERGESIGPVSSPCSEGGARSATEGCPRPERSPPPPAGTPLRGPAAGPPPLAGEESETGTALAEPAQRAVRAPLPHDSAAAHVAGTALYADDAPEAADLLHLAFGQSTHAHARIVAMDLAAVRAAPGVVAVFTAQDIPGRNNVAPVAGDDRLFAKDEVVCVGQSLFVVAATSATAARRAARLARVEYDPLPAYLTIAEARAAGSVLEPAQRMARGDAAAALAGAAHRLQGSLEIGGQDHFYLEGQVALATPGEDGQIHILASTQHPSEVQHLVAELLGIAHADVIVEVRRMGGAFGGKETQAALFAAAAALVAAKTGRPAKLRADRDDDMVMTGKRHDFAVSYDVGFDAAGRIEGLRLDLAARCGSTADLSLAINDRAMFHADNSYFLPAVEISSHRLKTHTVSNTAFRGFGGPQGMMAIERVVDAIAARLGLDPLAVRQANLYGPGRDETPYGMTVTDNVAPAIIAELAERTDYPARAAAVAAFNASHRLLKKGLALTPVKFGISFTTTHLNQAGALVHLYTDGSILLNHGGTEMGQGLNIKVAQIVADVFAAPVERVRITSARTDKVPNTSATAASAGSDLNGMAAKNAAEMLRTRLTTFASRHHGVDEAAVRFTRDGVRIGGTLIPFAALCRQAHMGRVSLSATGYYATPDIAYDRAAHHGRPFYYFAYGAALSEVVIDALTGEHRVAAVDILHDVGRSLNPAIDLGQIEGGFVQGMGWLTTEELVFDDAGRLLTHAPSTYKIPTAGDRPRRMDIRLWRPGRNVEPTVHRSKAVGEPPLMLAISVFSALTQAVAATAPGRGLPKLDAPATPERILAAIGDLAARPVFDAPP